jgi:hypothetical protein
MLSNAAAMETIRGHGYVYMQDGGNRAGTANFPSVDLKSALDTGTSRFAGDCSLLTFTSALSSPSFSPMSLRLIIGDEP